jgi:hypothetical protein
VAAMSICDVKRDSNASFLISAVKRLARMRWYCAYFPRYKTLASIAKSKFSFRFGGYNQ